MGHFNSFDEDVDKIRELSEEEAKAQREAKEAEEAEQAAEGQDDEEELDEEAKQVRDRLRAKRREERKRQIKMARTVVVVFLVALMGGMIWAFANLAGRTNHDVQVTSVENIRTFSRDWYSDWEFDDGKKSELDEVDLSDYFAMGSDAQQEYAKRNADPDSLFATKGSTCFQTCMVSREGNDYTLQVSYYEADGDLDEDEWQKLVEDGPKQDTYTIKVDSNSKITDIKKN